MGLRISIEASRTTPAVDAAGPRGGSAQALDDVLHIDDGVVDNGAEGDDESGQHHGVDGRILHVETNPAATSDSGMASRLISATPLEEECAEHDHDEHRADDERFVRLSIDNSMKVAGRKMV